LKFGFAKLQRYGFFVSHLSEKHQKQRLYCPNATFFRKKSKKLLAHKEISCTFAAAFGNE
jgi:hypothetical protein